MVSAGARRADAKNWEPNSALFRLAVFKIKFQKDHDSRGAPQERTSGSENNANMNSDTGLKLEGGGPSNR